MDSNIIKRFFAKVGKPDKKGCHPWLGAKFKSGYGEFRYDGRVQLSHRVAYIIKHGHIPKGSHHGTTCVLHSCDNPACVNINHLFLGSHTDNMQDKVKKSRHNPSRGSKNGCSKLTEKKIAIIRELTNGGNITQIKIAQTFNVHRDTIRKITNGTRWKHVK